ncbi:hypothetical protein POTOM_039971 [Populus tomentosa]|uniref:RRM domain-containing protein n=1 Tax=Populus tomentosa TaxID=118781 RepID=A0A8X7YTL1_POPTO|nr:hypothetical protein POTOM_039971 [Populus tomentosa]
MRATTAALAAAAAAPRGGFLRLFSTTSTSSSSFPFPQATQQTPAREQAEPNTNLFCEWMDSRKLRWREVSVRVVIVLDVGEKGGAKNKMRIGRQCSCAGIAGLSKRTTSEGLREAFSKFGEVVQARVVTDRVSGYSKGFGFVKYATLEDAAEGIKGMDGQEIQYGFCAASQVMGQAMKWSNLWRKIQNLKFNMNSKGFTKESLMLLKLAVITHNSGIHRDLSMGLGACTFAHGNIYMKLMILPPLFWMDGLYLQSMLDPDNHLLNLKTTQAWDYGNSATDRRWQ